MSSTVLRTYSAILHGPTLIRELNDHWEDPSRANFIWLGLLFAVLGIAMLAYHQHGEPLEYEGLSDSLFRLYRTRTAQCLLRGDISRCLPYTVETLRLNALAELNRKDDSRRALYITTGVIVRAAINMVCYTHFPSRRIVLGGRKLLSSISLALTFDTYRGTIVILHILPTFQCFKQSTAGVSGPQSSAWIVWPPSMSAFRV